MERMMPVISSHRSRKSWALQTVASSNSVGSVFGGGGGGVSVAAETSSTSLDPKHPVASRAEDIVRSRTVVDSRSHPGLACIGYMSQMYFKMWWVISLRE